MKKNITYLTILFLLLMISSCRCIPWDGQAPQGKISQSKADSLETNYKNNQYRFINDAVNSGAAIINIGENKKTADSRVQNRFLVNTTTFQDTREVNFDIEEIIRYVGIVRDEASNKGYSNVGIRIYSGSYLVNGKLQATMFLVGTYEDSNGDQKNMDGIYCLNYGNSGQPPEEFIPSSN